MANFSLFAIKLSFVKKFPDTDKDKGMHITKVWKKKIGDKKNS